MGRATIHGAPPQAPPPAAPTSRLRGVMTEWRTPLQVLRLGLSASRFPNLPRGKGRITILVPGYKAPEASMEPLRRFLQALGHDARHWGFGVNQGRVEKDTHALLEALPTEGPVALVGWSLGGVISREVAREAPDRVERVITYGTPVIGGPTYTLAARGWSAEATARIVQQIEQRNIERPIRVPMTAFFSRRDRIVHWAACLDHHHAQVEHIEVSSSHTGMGVDPDVWRISADRLAAR